MSIEQTEQHSPGRAADASPLFRESPETLASQGVEERAFSLFQPDILLPAQYSATMKRKNYLEPEKRLILAVLEDAVFCFQNHLLASDTKGQILFREAEQWILEEDNDWLFSFENVCDVLGFDPRYVRKGLIRWKQKKLAERPRAQIYHLSLRAKRKEGQAHEPKSLAHEFLRELTRLVS